MKNRFCFILGVVYLLFLQYSCDNELHITMPPGPKGQDGASAFELWAQAVRDSNLDWDADRIDVGNFFLYLQGNSGMEGKDAYEIWLDQIAIGILNPHEQGQIWDANRNGINDFWYFLTGAKGQDGSHPVIGSNGNWFIEGIDSGIQAKGQDGSSESSVISIGINGNWIIDGTDTGMPSNGQSAYELWLEEVAKGIQNPHSQGQEWPKDQTTVQDFWEFLRGEDGITREPDDERIIAGRPNVLAQSVVLDNDEFVSPEDGSVRYRVYNNSGDPASGAIVTLPGINREFTADENGFFTVDKYDLPAQKPVGKIANVTYIGTTTSIQSAENTDVPARMLVRIRLQNTHPVPRLDIANAKTHIAFYPVVERSTDGGLTWGQVPAYLGGINAMHGIKAYKCIDSDDFKSYDIKEPPFVTSVLPTTYNNLIDVTKTDYIVRVNRLRRRESRPQFTYTNPADLWDEDEHYFTLVVDGTYYGEILQLNAVIKMAPIQSMPFIKNITAADFSSETYSVRPVTGEFDVSNVDPNLMFRPAFIQEERGGFIYYEPVVDLNYETAAELIVTFGTGASANRPVILPTVADPTFRIETANISKATAPTNWISIALTTNTHYFYSLNTIGRFRFGVQEGNVNQMIITKTGSGAAYIYDDIAVTYIP